jgi:hypothetical protein
MTERGKWTGMLAIARFNWPFYGAALVTLVAGIFAIRVGGGFLIGGGLTIFGCGYFLIGSLGISHWIYDCSDLYQWRWLEKALGNITTGNFTLCHSGFDEASQMLKQKLPTVAWTILDHYDPVTMTESSIRRARLLYPPTAGTVAAPFDCWALEDASQQAVFGLLAIHECGVRKNASHGLQRHSDVSRQMGKSSSSNTSGIWQTSWHLDLATYISIPSPLGASLGKNVDSFCTIIFGSLPLLEYSYYNTHDRDIITTIKDRRGGINSAGNTTYPYWEKTSMA